MRVRRSVLVVALVATGALAGLGVGLLGGLDGVSALWSSPGSTRAVGEQGETAEQEAPPPRRNTLEIGERTVFFLEGVLPMGVGDGTTSGLAGSLVLRGQCHDGSLTVTVSSTAGSRETSVACDGKAHESTLGTIKVGEAIGVQTSGRKGTDFAVELQAR